MGFQTTPNNNYLLFGLQRTFLNTSFDTLLEIANNSSKSQSQSKDIVESTVLNTENDLSRTNTVAIYLHITDTTDNYRIDTKSELLEMINLHPLCGNGLGASIRSKETGLVEYFYLDLLNKVGIIGFILYLFPVFYMIFLLINSYKSRDDFWIIRFSWLCGLSSFLVATHFNPYMNNALGICFYGLCIATFLVDPQDSVPKLNFL